MIGLCSACNINVLVTQKRIRCTIGNCALLYHNDCVYYDDTAPSSRATWICPSCTANKPKQDNTNTPIQSKNRKQQALENNPIPPPLLTVASSDQDTIINEIRNLRLEMKQHFENQQASLKNFDSKLSEVQKEVRILGGHFTSLREDVDELTKSVQFLSDAHDAQLGSSEETRKSITHLSSENQNLRLQLTELNSKLDLLEQQARDCNLEIQCIPENKNENIFTLVQQMASAVSCDLKLENILNLHRVAKVDAQSQRPRSIVVKLSSPRIRDDFLASVKRFNKKHQQDKLNTSHLGIPVNKRAIYVMEHLSLKNKKLHAATRLAAKEKKYEYVWIRNGRIFVRKNNESGALWIKNTEALSNLN
ncbi:jg214 [Pararge aegeria aegeria]|uniref:Jg214 protein n=1 Tax=Pararge aegeria aegeria TaxID=348720 RepID=A0A8S4QL75_9NEOP|nr:jg214 [Pararge aegeria aegeria]